MTTQPELRALIMCNFFPLRLHRLSNANSINGIFVLSSSSSISYSSKKIRACEPKQTWEVSPRMNELSNLYDVGF